MEIFARLKHDNIFNFRSVTFLSICHFCYFCCQSVTCSVITFAVITFLSIWLAGYSNCVDESRMFPMRLDNSADRTFSRFCLSETVKANVLRFGMTQRLKEYLHQQK